MSRLKLFSEEELYEKLNKILNDSDFSKELMNEKKTYEPKELTIQKLKENNEQMGYLARVTSMFIPRYASDILSCIIDILKKELLPFNPIQVNRMSNETKNKIIENALYGIKISCRHERDKILGENQYFREEFEELKLKILLENDGKEPEFIFEEKDFALYEKAYVEMYSNILNYLLFVDFEFYESYVKDEWDKFEEYCLLNYNCIRHYSENLTSECKQTKAWFHKLENGMTHQDIKRYKSYKTCLLTDTFSSFVYVGKNYKLFEHRLLVIANNIELVYELTGRSGIHRTLNAIYSYVKALYERGTELSNKDKTIINAIPELLNKLRVG